MGEAIGTQIKSPDPTADAPQKDAVGIADPKSDPNAAIPEKFGGDVGKLAEAYKALEQKQSGGTPDPVVTPVADPGGEAIKAAAEADVAKVAADKAAADKAAADKGEEDKGDLTIEKDVYYGEAVDTAMEGAGLNPADVAKEWDDNQDLSQETFDALAKAGYPREIVDMYIAGFTDKVAEATALQEQQVADVKELAGGDDGYTNLTNWAAATLPREELESYNKIIDSGDGAMIQLAVRGLQSKFNQAEGRDPNLIQGGGVGAGDVFESHQQVSIAMKAARESGDPAQIHAVEQKALRSPAL